MTGWNIADVLEIVAAEVPDAPAVIQGPRRITWGELDRRAARLGAWWVARGLGRQDKVALYLRNRPEYIEALVAALKAALVPVNTNYRYEAGELTYLWDNADVSAVVFQGEFTPVVERVRPAFPHVKAWLWVADGSGTCPDWATPYEQAATDGEASPAPWDRDGDDLLLLYTGGTTGLPKGVMWRQDDVFVLLGNASRGGYGDEQDLAHARARVASPGRRHLPAAPLMHGSGLFSCIPIMARGGAIVLLEGRSFDPAELLDAVHRDQVNSVNWVGDAFAKPVLAALDAHPGRWDLSSLRHLTSGGVMFGEEIKRGILRHAPHLLIADVFGASEAITVGQSITTADTTPPTGSFRPSAHMRVIAPDGREIVPGSGERGLIAFRGRQPLGYYKDEAKTRATFQVIDGHRYSVPGDWATVARDGSVTLLGRDSACINTGGEKVFAEEVEGAVKGLPGVADAVVVGVPDDKYGQMVVAVVEPAPGAARDAAGIIAGVRSRLAGYKAPKRVFFVESMRRAPSGKADLAAIKRLATELAQAEAG
ncbi:AMP-binding protein [Nonomuraea purpurea]|uniref:AMP-binding protein n=1 Tax=Nonomuraea purpurea TaxID=1849276 RepID=A0ABV8FYZ6_9ACTN